MAMWMDYTSSKCRCGWTPTNRTDNGAAHEEVDEHHAQHMDGRLPWYDTYPPMPPLPPSEVEQLRQRVSALEAELDKAQLSADVRGNMLRYIAFVTTGDENGDAQLGADRLKAQLEAAQPTREAVEKLTPAEQIALGLK